MVTQNDLLAYIYFNKKIDMHRDASNSQLRSVFIQEGNQLLPRVENWTDL